MPDFCFYLAINELYGDLNKLFFIIAVGFYIVFFQHYHFWVVNFLYLIFFKTKKNREDRETYYVLFKINIYFNT